MRATDHVSNVPHVHGFHAAHPIKAFIVHMVPWPREGALKRAWNKRCDCPQYDRCAQRDVQSPMSSDARKRPEER